MTAICAATGENLASDKVVGYLLSELRHRATDGSQILRWMRVSIGHAHMIRLPEDDPTARVFECPEWIVATDARLDNRDELLEALMPIEEPASDNYLVFCALAQWGMEALGRLRGDFAFVALEKKTNTIFAGRDPFGVRPLFYRLYDKDIAISTEAGALLSIPSMGPPLSIPDIRIKQFLGSLTGRGTHGEELEFRRLFRIRPGHLLVWKDGETTQTPYFELKAPNLSEDLNWASEFRKRFEKAVASRLRSSGPIASLLSGGLDSSSITAVAAQLTERRLKVVAGTFPNFKKGDEQPYIDAITAFSGIECKKVKLDELSPINSAQSIIRDLKRPFNAPGIAVLGALLPIISETGARQYLDGHGGDEVVSYGFDRILQLAREKQWLALWRDLPAWSGLFGTNRLLDFIRFFLRFTEIRGTYRLRRVLLRLANPRTDLSQSLLKSKFEALLPTQKGQARGSVEKHIQSILNPLILESFELYDVVAAKHGLRPLFPFFDQSLVELCLAMPDDVKLRHGYSRHVLRVAMSGYLPDAVRWRKSKFDFSDILRHRLKGWHEKSNLQISRYYESPLLQFLSRKKLHSFLKNSINVNRISSLDAQNLWRLILIDYWIKFIEKSNEKI